MIKLSDKELGRLAVEMVAEQFPYGDSKIVIDPDDEFF